MEANANAGSWISYVLRHTDDFKALFQIEQDAAAEKITLWQAAAAAIPVLQKLAADFPVGHEASTVPSLVGAVSESEHFQNHAVKDWLPGLLQSLLPVLLQLVGKK